MITRASAPRKGSPARNDGNLSFTDASYPPGIARSTTPYVGWGDAFLDLDNSGWLDFILVKQTWPPAIPT